jgi:hypothetical protein
VNSAWPAVTAGVTELLAADAGDVPIAFLAVTVNVYAVPLVKFSTRIGDELPTTGWDGAGGLDVTA